MKQSQKHGLDWENEIRKKVFKLDYVCNSTDKHDIIVKDENISVKCAKIDQNGNATICGGKLLRFYDLDPNTKIFLILYKQCGVKKRIYKCMEINYTKELHEHFFNKISREVLEEYDDNVKRIPTKIKGLEAKAIFPYLPKKKELKKKYNIKNIDINPKVDRAQSRVQCSFKLKDIPKKFILNRNKECKFRGISITGEIHSSSRSRGGLTHPKLDAIYEKNMNKLYSKVKGFKRKKKDEKMEFLKKHNLV